MARARWRALQGGQRPARWPSSALGHLAQLAHLTGTLDPDDRHHVGRRRLPALVRQALRNQLQLAPQDLAPDDDRGVGTAEHLVLAVLDAALSRLHGDVLHYGK